MSSEDLLSQLGHWAGYHVTEVQREAATGDQPATIRIRLEPDADRPLICDHCGGEAERVHDRTWRTVRDLPLFEARTELEVLTCRVWCPHCEGPKRERVDWLDAHQRLTRRFADSIFNLCQMLPVAQVAAFYGVHWHTVKQVDKRALAARFEAIDLSQVTVLGVDEFALHKGHRYATVIINPTRKQVLWVGAGRSREAIRPFFTDVLGPEGCARIEAVVMDMSTAFEQEVRAQCPNAEVVFDLFHVVAKYGREVIDRVRVDEANRLRHDRAARKVVKSSRWLLLRNRDNLASDRDRVRLNELLDANQALMTVYLLKEDLKALWRYRHIGYARRFWQQWLERAESSGIKPLKRFADRLQPYLRGIFAHCHHPLHTSLLEGINNRIKVIKRMAYGFRDEEYFFLKIRAAFPGNVR
jgi:transposase